MVPSWRRAGRRALTAAVLSAAVLSAPVLSGAAAAAADSLQLTPPDLSVPGQVEVVATVPPMLTGRPLAEGAFTAAQAGSPVPVAATRVVDGPAELVLALDPGVPPDVLVAEQSAATDLLRSLPPDLPVVLRPGATRGTARSALADVAGLAAPAAGASPAPLLGDLGPAPAGRRLFLVVAGCDALGRLADPAGPDRQVSVLAVGAGCEDRAGALATPTAGLVRTGLDAGSLQSAMDEASRVLLGQYRLRIQADRAAGPVQVSVTSGSATATGTVPLAAPAPAATSAAPAADPGRSPGPVLAAIALLALLALGLVGLAVNDRYRDRRAAAS